GAQQPAKETKWPDDPEGRAFSALQGEAFGRELAQHDMQRRDDDKRKRNGEGMGGGASFGRELAQHDMQRRDDDKRKRNGDGIGAGAGEGASDTGEWRLDQMG